MNTKVLLLICFALLTNCETKKIAETNKDIIKNLSPDVDNGGLFIPEGFGAIVVSDGVGPSRHLARGWFP